MCKLQGQYSTVFRNFDWDQNSGTCSTTPVKRKFITGYILEQRTLSKLHEHSFLVRITFGCMYVQMYAAICFLRFSKHFFQRSSRNVIMKILMNLIYNRHTYILHTYFVKKTLYFWWTNTGSNTTKQLLFFNETEIRW